MRLEQMNSKALKMTNNNRYLLATAVAKRVNQLLNGDPSQLERDTVGEELTNVAIEEIAEGFIKVNLD
jgi:DNA-directed RNA polymerase subunit omega